MGLNISALIVNDNKDNVLESLKKEFNLKIDFKTVDTWDSVYPYSFNEDDEIIILHKKNQTLVYITTEYLLRKESLKLLRLFNKATSFLGSETSMAFEFKFYENGKRISTDKYVQNDTGIKSRGKIF